MFFVLLHSLKQIKNKFKATSIPYYYVIAYIMTFKYLIGLGFFFKFGAQGKCSSPIGNLSNSKSGLPDRTSFYTHKKFVLTYSLSSISCFCVNVAATSSANKEHLPNFILEIISSSLSRSCSIPSVSYSLHRNQ